VKAGVFSVWQCAVRASGGDQPFFALLGRDRHTLLERFHAAVRLSAKGKGRRLPKMKHRVIYAKAGKFH
jgi:hypothetical protein